VNPVARLYADQGIIHLNNKNYNEAVKAFENSVKYDDGWGKNRILLAKAYYEVSKYNESFMEYSRSVFFGAKPDKVFKEKLRNKFLELKKNNPQLSNPFNEVNSE
jgi:tetratricopeptide (TPR) repeat protein